MPGTINWFKRNRGLRAAVVLGMFMMAAPMPARALGLADPVTLNPGTVAFGSVPLGVTLPQTVTLTNTSSRTIKIGTVFVLPNVFSATDQCGALAPGAQCALTVSYTPARAGSTQGELLVFLQGGGLEDFLPAGAVALNGTAINGVPLDGTVWEAAVKRAQVRAVAVKADGSDGVQLADPPTDANGNFALVINHRLISKAEACASCHFIQDSTPAAQALRARTKAVAAASASQLLARAPVRVEASAGSYASEEDGATVTNTSEITALVTDLSSSPVAAASLALVSRAAAAAQVASAAQVVELNPLTTFADSIARTQLKRAAAKAQITSRVGTKAATEFPVDLLGASQAATAQVEALYGITTDPSKLVPDFTAKGIGNDAGSLGLVLGAMAAEDEELCPGAPGGLVQALATDVGDGVFDGLDPNGNPIPYCNGPATQPSLRSVAATAQLRAAPALTELGGLLPDIAGTVDFRRAIPMYVYTGVTAEPLVTVITTTPSLGVTLTGQMGLTGGDVGGAAPPSVNGFPIAQSPRMSMARTLPTATLLQSGKVLIAGGFDLIADNDAYTVLGSTDLYDAANNCFAGAGGGACASETAPALLTARGLATATLLNNGMVLIAGGIDGSGSPLASTELYDPAGNSFAAGPSMNAARAGATATLLNDGRVLIAGGFGEGFSPLSSTELFNGTSSFAASANTPTMNEARAEAAAILLTNNKVLIAGGTLDGSAELFEPVANCFDGSNLTGCSGLTTPTMAAPRLSPTATLLPNGDVLIVGGEINPSPGTPADLYDYLKTCFAGVTGTPCQTEVAPLINDSSISAAAAPASALANNKVLIFANLPALPLFDGNAGFDCFAGQASTACTSETDPVNGDPGVDESTATLLQNGEVLIAGGESGGASVATTALYAP